MNHAPTLLEDMKAANVQPDIATYSALIKGYCNSGGLDRALKMFRELRVAGNCSPDEAMYNCLLGSCAKESRPDEALEILADMRKSRIMPSSFTLSMIVKLMSRTARLDQAFAVLKETAKEYNVKINIQVYTCLIQGCFQNGQA